MSSLGYVQNATEIAILDSEAIQTQLFTLENDASETISFTIPTSGVVDYELTLPAADAAGVLTTDGAGTLSWATVGSTAPDTLADYDVYEDLAFTWLDSSSTPIVSSGAQELRIEKIGEVVNLSATAGTNFGATRPKFLIPTRFLPTTDQFFFALVSDNGTISQGQVQVDVTGESVHFSPGFASGNFAGVAGTNSTLAINLKWNVNN